MSYELGIPLFDFSFVAVFILRWKLTSWIFSWGDSREELELMGCIILNNGLDERSVAKRVCLMQWQFSLFSTPAAILTWPWCCSRELACSCCLWTEQVGRSWMKWYFIGHQQVAQLSFLCFLDPSTPPIYSVKIIF